MDTTSKDTRPCPSNVLILGGEDIQELLAGQEHSIIAVMRSAYQAHGKGLSHLPYSTFLRFPDNPSNRIIALPAFLGDQFNSAGIKWIASFPANVDHGIDRASAVLILNSTETGRIRAIMEGSVISAKRTAASAALAVQVLRTAATPVIGVIGCGLISFEIVKFLSASFPDITTVLAFDLEGDHACFFQERCRTEMPLLEVRIVSDLNTILTQATLVSFATTAGTPHIESVAQCRPGTLVLHISLRDLAPEVILCSDNVVDDIDHVCRANTSVHLAEQKVGHREFIRCTLADILNGNATARKGPDDIVIFSPFGLGVLDIALGEYVFAQASLKGKGFNIAEFLPRSWNRECINSNL